MSYAWTCLQNDYAGVPQPERITLLTVNGTAVSMWDGPPADTARALGDDQFYWQPIDYPAATFPMLDSRLAGQQEMVRQINMHRGKIALAGYSQGALVTGAVWRDEILNPQGSLHHRLNDVVGIMHWGDPMRCPGIANGNKYAGMDMPKELDGQVTGGIAGPENLKPEETPDFLLSFANDLDLYAACPIGADRDHPAEVGHIEHLIYDVIQKVTVMDLWAVVEEVLKAIFVPTAYLIPMIQAIYNAGLFFLSGMNAPHYHYEATIDPAVRFLKQTAAKVLT